FEAVQESLQRHVALKVLPFHSWVKPKHLERFRREAQAAARLHHTNIVPVFGVGEHEGIHYYAMQFIHCQGLGALLDEFKRLRQVFPPQSRDQVSEASLAQSVAESLLTGRRARTGIWFPESEVGEENGMDSSTSGSSPRTPDSGSHSDLSSQTEYRYFRSVAQIGIQVAEALEYAPTWESCTGTSSPRI